MRLVTHLEQLREVALDQQGYVTSSQAAQLGITGAHLSTMVARGRLERAAHGVYRVPQVAETHADHYRLAVLWTGVEQACLSHETALQVWNISDINPDAVHVCIPQHRRLRRKGGKGYVVHHEDLDPGQIGWWEGIPTVTVYTAIAQCISTGVPSYLIRQALERSSQTSQLLPTQHHLLTDHLEQRDASP